MVRSLMNIKFFAPGSKESHCPALPKSQGYSHNKQSCLSPGEILVSAHTHTEKTVSKEEAMGKCKDGLTGAV